MGEMADELFDQALLDSLDNFLFLKEKLAQGIWPAQNGEIAIERMTDKHLENAIKYMERNPDTTIAKVGGIKFLRAEQKRRLSALYGDHKGGGE